MVELGTQHFRSVLGHYPTGVCVVTGVDDQGGLSGLVVGSFTSVSLDPPLVAFFPDKKSTSWPRIRDHGHFCVNILGDDQLDLCLSFAAKGGDKFADVAHQLSEQSVPKITDAVAHIECALEQVAEAGDHFMVLGRVIQLTIERDAKPLIFHRGQYGSFAGLIEKSTP